MKIRSRLAVMPGAPQSAFARSSVLWLGAFGLAVLCQACQSPIQSSTSREESAVDLEKAVIVDCVPLPPSKISKANQYFLKAEKELDALRYQAAIANYSLAIKADPLFAHAYASRGVAQKKLGNLREAIGDYKKAIDLYPKHRERDGCLLDNIGNAYSGLGEYSIALDYHDRANKISPSNPTILSNRGSTKMSAEDYAGAVRDFRKSLSLKPRPNFAILNIGQALLFDDRPEESLRYFDQAIDQYQRAMDYSGRGFAYFSLGKVELACSDWKVAVANGIQSLAGKIAKHCH